jgi:hypothetical protein
VAAYSEIEMTNNELDFLTVRGRKVRIDEKGRVCLNDIHKAGGFTKHQKPSDWGALTTTISLTAYTAKKTSGNSGHLSKEQIISVYCVRKGRNGGFWVHPNLAIAYAKYLSPALHYEVNNVFLSFKSGDATLADETLQRASPEDNEWAGVRALSRNKRNQYTSTLQDHGVAGYGFAQCTDAAYLKLFDAPAKALKTHKNLPAAANLRDNLDTNDLVMVMATEVLATGRINEQDSHGNIECREATRRSAGFIRQAIDADKADRRKERLV